MHGEPVATVVCTSVFSIPCCLLVGLSGETLRRVLQIPGVLRELEPGLGYPLVGGCDLTAGLGNPWRILSLIY